MDSVDSASHLKAPKRTWCCGARGRGHGGKEARHKHLSAIGPEVLGGQPDCRAGLRAAAAAARERRRRRAAREHTTVGAIAIAATDVGAIAIAATDVGANVEVRGRRVREHASDEAFGDLAVLVRHARRRLRARLDRLRARLRAAVARVRLERRELRARLGERVRERALFGARVSQAALARSGERGVADEPVATHLICQLCLTHKHLICQFCLS